MIYIEVSGTFAPLTVSRFSPIRPLVFASASLDGFIYIFDLQQSSSGPVVMLEALTNPVLIDDVVNNDTSTSSSTSNTTSNSSSSSGNNKSNNNSRFRQLQQGMSRRVGITGLAFNHKQRDLLAACDLLGRIHIWRLNWVLANKSPLEQAELDKLGNTSAREADE